MNHEKNRCPILSLLLALFAVSASSSAITSDASQVADAQVARILKVRDLSLPGTPLHPRTDQQAGERAALTARLEILYPERRGSRTVVRGYLAVPAAQLEPNPHGFYNFRIQGEIHRQGAPLDRLGQRFDLPTGRDEEELILPFESTLRPGTYELVLEVEEITNRKRFATRRVLDVPRLAADASSDPVATPRRPEIPRLRLLRPSEPILSGFQRFTAEAGEGVERVAFFLDGRPVLTKTRPPFEVELDLGDTPRTVEIRAEGFGPGGEPLARDRLVVNSGGEPFGIRVTMPGSGRIRGSRFDTRMELDLPPGRALDRVELFLGEERAAVLDRPPLLATLELAEAGRTTPLRAVAHLEDGATTEDVVLLNPPGAVDEMSVHLVELFVAVFDRQGRLARDLARGDFRIFENGVEQRIAQFDRAASLPLVTALVLDVSSSMLRRFDDVKQAALDFLTGMRPQDRSMLVTFADQPRAITGLTGDLATLANGLIGLEPAGGTSLNDGLIFTIKRLAGLGGQKAVLLFSDGQEWQSRATPEEVIELARRSGVTLYAIGYRVDRYAREARALLSRLAGETGGQSFFVDDADTVAAAYAAIQQQLACCYLVAYPSSHGDDDAFRLVDVQLQPAGLSASTVRGYYP